MRSLLLFLAVVALLAPRVRAQTVATFRNGDVFEMRVSGVPLDDAQQFAQQYSVGPDGTVNVPLVGEIKAAGLTTPQLERALQNRLVAGKIFTQPTVIVSPVQGVRTVSVIGAVINPGRVTWNVDLTLMAAISERGGPNEFANRKSIRLVRESKVIGVYNLNEIEKDPAKDQKLLPGDQVLVRE
jgi:protein involved in polysaccharide export with SLBB domain